MTDISAVYQTTVPLDPVTCLLGVVDEEIFTPLENVAVLRLLYIACKQISSLWISLHNPKQWVD